MDRQHHVQNKFSISGLSLGMCILLSSCGTVTELSDETHSLISLVSIVATGTLIGFASVIIIYEALKKITQGKITQGKNKKRQDKITAQHSDTETIEPIRSTNEKIEKETDINSKDSRLSNAIEEIVQINNKIDAIGKTLESTNILRTENKEITKELKSYVNGYNLSMLELAVSDLIDAYEYTSDIDNQLNDNSSFNEDVAKGYIKAISSHLNQGVDMLGIETFAPDIGSDYQTEPNIDLGKKIIVQDQSQIGKIAEIIKEGWRSKLPEDETKRKIIRKSVVAVYTESE